MDLAQPAVRGMDRAPKDLVEVLVQAHTGRLDVRVMAQRHGVLTGPVTAMDGDTFTIVEYGSPITVDWTDLVAADAG